MTQSTSAQQADHYVNRLDLGDDPFSSQFESDYYFTTTARQQILDQLVHFSRFSDQLVMLTGASGSGTSTLLEQALLLLSEVMDCCYINAELEMTPQQVMESLCQQLYFHLDKPANISDFMTHLRTAVKVDDEIEPILIAVDQAHFLPLEGFELLRSIVSDSGDMVRLVLVGEYQVEQLAVLAKFDREQTKILELEPLSETETEEYLLGLLRSVGYAGEHPFSADQLAVLHEQASGSFVELQQLAPVLLSSEPQQAESRFRFGMPIVHVVAALIIGVALLLAWLYQGPDQDGTRDYGAKVAAADNQAAAKSAGKPLADSRLGTIDRGPGQRQVASAESRAVGLQSAQQQKPAAVAGDSIKTEAKPLASRAEASHNEAVSTAAADSKPPESEPAAVAPKAVAGNKPVAAKLPDPKPAAPQAQTANAAKPVPAKADAGSTGPLPVREQRLLELAGSNYVLQLMGAIDQQRTEEFVKRYAGRLPVTYFETRHQNKPWFVAIVGPYDDKTVAVAQIMQLPVELQKLRPWARSVNSIQKDIRAKQQ